MLQNRKAIWCFNRLYLLTPGKVKEDMILGLGVDLVEVARVERVLKRYRERFLIAS